MKEIKSNMVWCLIMIIIIVISLTLWEFHKNKTSKYTVVNIVQNGKVIKEFDLSEIKEPIEFKIESEDKRNFNIIRAENKRIAVADADCPDKICVKTGYICDGSIPIVCLPNKLSIVIKEKEDEYDAVAGQ